MPHSISNDDDEGSYLVQPTVYRSIALDSTHNDSGSLPPPLASVLYKPCPFPPTATTAALSQPESIPMLPPFYVLPARWCFYLPISSVKDVGQLWHIVSTCATTASDHSPVHRIPERAQLRFALLPTSPTSPITSGLVCPTFDQAPAGGHLYLWLDDNNTNNNANHTANHTNKKQYIVECHRQYGSVATFIAWYRRLHSLLAVAFPSLSVSQSSTHPPASVHALSAAPAATVTTVTGVVHQESNSSLPTLHLNPQDRVRLESIASDPQSDSLDCLLDVLVRLPCDRQTREWFRSSCLLPWWRWMGDVIVQSTRACRHSADCLRAWRLLTWLSKWCTIQDRWLLQHLLAPLLSNTLFDVSNGHRSVWPLLLTSMALHLVPCRPTTLGVDAWGSLFDTRQYVVPRHKLLALFHK